MRHDITDVPFINVLNRHSDNAWIRANGVNGKAAPHLVCIICSGLLAFHRWPSAAWLLGATKSSPTGWQRVPIKEGLVLLIGH